MGQEPDKLTPLLSQRMEEVSGVKEAGLELWSRWTQEQDLMILGGVYHQLSSGLGDFPPTIA